MAESKNLSRCSPFKPFVQYGGWALACYQAGHNGIFDEKDSFVTRTRFRVQCVTTKDRFRDNSIAIRAFKVLQTLHTWSKPFAELMLFYDQHRTEIDYLCSDTWYPDFVDTDFDGTFRKACTSGKLQCAQWLQSKWPEIDHINDVFEHTCCSGQLEVAQWLQATFPESIRPITQRLFHYACCNGHVEVASWVKGQLPHIHNHIYSGYGDSFREACRSGHLNVAQWLLTQWPEIDYHSENEFAFRHACAQGHLEVAKWLKTRFPDIDHRIMNEEPFRKACEFGNLHIAQWLKAQFPDIDHHAVSDYAFYSKNFQVRKWMKTLP